MLSVPDNISLMAPEIPRSFTDSLCVWCDIWFCVEQSSLATDVPVPWKPEKIPPGGDKHIFFHLSLAWSKKMMMRANGDSGTEEVRFYSLSSRCLSRKRCRPRERTRDASRSGRKWKQWKRDRELERRLRGSGLRVNPTVLCLSRFASLFKC